MDLDQRPRGPIGTKDDPYADPNEDPSYAFKFDTRTYSKNENADARGDVKGIVQNFSLILTASKKENKFLTPIAEENLLNLIICLKYIDLIWKWVFLHGLAFYRIDFKCDIKKAWCTFASNI